ncbi:hypothetical protein NEMBOFW57_004144 [Staphylotrichum longicolle]|uniref:Aminoglycoside phosphotransferase domain-containing protein n=1 Tax=Staphylotrichum longicolle TaxID=669026 RepID=A0AAD4F924_9PEZI|nr:hypothetical protein NEMBOFW57_004144 [Staphylotrichum longicolle]
MASRPSLPYYAPPDLLPAPLPTVADILASKSFLSEVYNSTHVVRVGDHFIVKYGKWVTLQEGENMLFVRQTTNIPVPTVYALFHDDETDFKFIVQEFIPGKTLEKVWPTLSDADKAAVASQLRRHMDELRGIPAPGFYGGIWRQPIQDYFFTDVNLGTRPHLDETISGPQETEEQWTEAMWRCLDDRVYGDDRLRLPFLRQHYHALFKGHKPVFTHADLLHENIMLREDGKTVVIIDWERSGWYPSYWEYGVATYLCRCKDDWWKWLPKILDEWVAEAGWLHVHLKYVLFF